MLYHLPIIVNIHILCFMFKINLFASPTGRFMLYSCLASGNVLSVQCLCVLSEDPPFETRFKLCLSAKESRREE